MADTYRALGALLARLRLRDNGDNSYSPLVSLGPGQPAEREVYGTAVAPAVNTTIATTGAVAGGRYRLVVYAFADDTPAIGKNLQLVFGGLGTLRVLYGPVGALVSWQLPDVSIAAGAVARVQNGSAGAAGTTYTAYLAAYPLP